MARPRKKIDPKQVEMLAAINCSYAEAAAVLGCNESTITRRFAQVFKRGREHGKMSLKRKMWDTAMGGHAVMMIWLSKQMLDYTDKVDHNQNIALKDKLAKAEEIASLPDAELKERIKKIE